MGNSTNFIKQEEVKMKKTITIFSIFILIFICSAESYSQEKYEYSKKLSFSDPSNPGLLQILRGEGDITITGYQGKEVLIETELDVFKTSDVEDEKAKGLKRISGTNFHVGSNEDENTIVITRSFGDKNELHIKVPYNTSIKIGGGILGKIKIPAMNIEIKQKNKGNMNIPIPNPVNFMGGILGGDITVTNVTGAIEISSIEGDITLEDVSGEVTANSVDGDLLVTFKDIEKGKPIFLSTVDGDIDVTLPPNIQADLSLQTLDGDMFTDFDIDIALEPERKTKDDKRSTDMVRFFRPGNAVYGKINGGGTEIQIRTVDGGIYLRKGK